MDKFHRLMELIDNNSHKISEKDYIEICKTMHEIWEKVKPPRFLLDQNKPMSIETFSNEIDMNQFRSLLESMRI